MHKLNKTDNYSLWLFVSIFFSVFFTEIAYRIGSLPLDTHEMLSFRYTLSFSSLKSNKTFFSEKCFCDDVAQICFSTVSLSHGLGIFFHVRIESMSTTRQHLWTLWRANLVLLSHLVLFALWDEKKLILDLAHTYYLTKKNGLKLF